MTWDRLRETFVTAFIWIGLASAAFVLWQVREALLLAFGAILAAIILRVLGTYIARWTHLPVGIGIAVAIFLIFAFCAVTAWSFGARLSSQFGALVQQIESSEKQIRAMFGGGSIAEIGSTVAQQGTSLIAGALRDLLSSGIRLVEGAIVLVVSAIYLAAQPDLYRRGLERMVSARDHDRIVDLVDVVGRALRQWLLGQMLLMIGVAAFTIPALYIVGVPSAVALGLIAGAAEIIPYIGPFLSAVPAVLVALTVGLPTVIWTVAVYLVVHALEGYVSAPLIQRYLVTIPPALILTGIVAADLLFGTVGIILAAPITVAIYVAVQHWTGNAPAGGTNAGADTGEGKNQRADA